nr:immunoglobulin light chain junction region [Macaca mulatta]
EYYCWLHYSGVDVF